jgi:hypothetical protein
MTDDDATGVSATAICSASWETFLRGHLNPYSITPSETLIGLLVVHRTCVKYCLIIEGLNQWLIR